jgi:hypothetical protein
MDTITLFESLVGTTPGSAIDSRVGYFRRNGKYSEAILAKSKDFSRSTKELCKQEKDKVNF